MPNQVIVDLLLWLKAQREEAEEWYPDDTSMREGAIATLDEVIEHIEDKLL